MKFKTIIVVFLCAFSILACKTKDKVDDSTLENGAVNIEDRADDLKAQLSKILPLDRENKVLKAMRPTQVDIEYLFQDKESVQIVEKFLAREYAILDRQGINPGANRTEITIVNRGSDFLKTEKDTRISQGYYNIAEKLKRGRMIYVAEFKEPGKELGYQLNCFVYINKRWVCFPKIYRAFKNIPA